MRRRPFLACLSLWAAWLAAGRPRAAAGGHRSGVAAAPLYPARAPGSEVWGFTTDPAEAVAVLAGGAGGVVGLAPGGWPQFELRELEPGVLELMEVREK